HDVATLAVRLNPRTRDGRKSRFGVQAMPTAKNTSTRGGLPVKSRMRGLRPSPAMVVACIALLVALAGTSVAAVTIVIPRNSVGSLQLKANSVNTSKVRNGSLRKADFAPGQIPAGKTGPPGPAGPRGPG